MKYCICYYQPISCQSFCGISWIAFCPALAYGCRQNGGDNVKLKRDKIWAELFEVVFDQRVVRYLLKNNPEYQELFQQKSILSGEYPVLDRLWDEESAICLTEEEHKAFGTYMKLRSDMEALEREYHYFLGQTDMLDLTRVMNGLSAESVVPDAEDRRMHILEHLKEGRMDDADHDFLKNEEFCRKRKQADELGKELNHLELSEEARNLLNDYVSAVESEWLCYGELAYQYGVEDMLTLLKQ